MEYSPSGIDEKGNECHGTYKQLDYEEADVWRKLYQKELKVSLWDWKEEREYRVYCSVIMFKTIAVC